MEVCTITFTYLQDNISVHLAVTTLINKQYSGVRLSVITRVSNPLYLVFRIPGEYIYLGMTSKTQL